VIQQHVGRRGNPELSLYCDLWQDLYYTAGDLGVRPVDKAGRDLGGF
jgi:hypothetical protein